MRWNDDRELEPEDEVPAEVKQVMAAIKEKLLAENPDAEIIMKAVPLSKAGEILKQMTPEQIEEMVMAGFRPEDEDDRPHKGEIIDISPPHPYAGKYEIAEVDYGFGPKMKAEQDVRGGESDPKGYDRVFFRTADSNPLVLWAAYCYKLLED